MSRKNFADMTAAERGEYAKAVKSLRQDAGLTQGALAELAGISRASVINLESGDTVPQADNLAKILTVLGVELDEPEFLPQTELWLTMFGTLIEATPEPAREQSVNKALRVLSSGIKRSSRPVMYVTPSGEDLHSVDLSDEALELAASDDDTGIDASRETS